MADVNGGALSFSSVLDNDQMNAAIEETLRRVQGFSNAVVGSGDVMDKTTQEIVESINIQKQVIQNLENTVAELKEETPLQRLGTPKNIADAVAFLVSDKAEFITGQVLAVNGGFVI